MKRRSLFAASLSTAAAAVAAETFVSSSGEVLYPHELFRETPEKKRAEVWMKHVKPVFVMAYFLGPADEVLDSRPSLPDDPFASKEDSAEAGARVLISEVGGDGAGPNLDVANLVARVRLRARLPLEKLTVLMEALVEPETKALIKECYDPHHVVIAYNHLGRPCGIIEICLLCNDFRLLPGGPFFRKAGCDVVKVARVLAEVGLPLSDEKNLSIDDYAKKVAEQIRDLEKSREEWKLQTQQKK